MKIDFQCGVDSDCKIYIFCHVGPKPVCLIYNEAIEVTRVQSDKALYHASLKVQWNISDGFRCFLNQNSIKTLCELQTVAITARLRLEQESTIASLCCMDSWYNKKTKINHSDSETVIDWIISDTTIVYFCNYVKLSLTVSTNYQHIYWSLWLYYQGWLKLFTS